MNSGMYISFIILVGMELASVLGAKADYNMLKRGLDVRKGGCIMHCFRCPGYERDNSGNIYSGWFGVKVGLGFCCCCCSF